MRATEPYVSEQGTAERLIDSTVGTRRQFAQYLVNERNLSPLTAYTYENNLQTFERFTGKDATEITSKDIRAFLRESEYGAATKNSVLVAIKAFHRWGVLEELWPQNGIAALSGPRLVRNPLPSLKPEQARSLLALASRPQPARLLYLGLFAGLRVSESASVGESEWLDDRLRVMGKGRKLREIPLHPQLADHRDLILSRSPSDSTL